MTRISACARGFEGKDRIVAMASPRLTVAVPVHNGGDDFQRCLECLQRQSWRDFRVIIFENCSTDNTVEIASRFVTADPRFEMRPSDRLLPALENFHRAISEGAGTAPYFCLRAADDYTSDNFLEVLVQALDENPGKCLAVSQVVQVEPGGGIVPGGGRWLEKFRRQENLRYGRGAFPASWYYGVYRVGAATDFLLSSQAIFPHVWGQDRLVVYKMISDFGAVFRDGATFFCQIGSQSDSRYKPGTFSAALRNRWVYYRACMNMQCHRQTTGIFDTLRSHWAAWRIAGSHTTSRIKLRQIRLLSPPQMT